MDFNSCSFAMKDCNPQLSNHARLDPVEAESTMSIERFDTLYSGD